MLSDLVVLEGDDRVIPSKNNESDQITWLDHIDKFGVWEFTFDGEHVFNTGAERNLRPGKPILGRVL